MNPDTLSCWNVIKIKLITCIGVIGYQERDGIGQDPGSEMLLFVRFDRYSISFLIDQPAGYDVLLCRPEIIRSVFIPVFVKTMCRNHSLLKIIRSSFRIKSFCHSFGTADMVVRIGTPQRFTFPVQRVIGVGKMEAYADLVDAVADLEYIQDIIDP